MDLRLRAAEEYRAWEPKVQCPYDKSHQLLPHRMSLHLTKCRRNHPEARMAVCSFNATHHVPQELYNHHLLTCPDNAPMLKDVYRTSKPQHQPAPPPPAPAQPDEAEEDWDAEVVDRSYNPAVAALQSPIGRPPPAGMSKALKKEWRQVELVRLQRLERGEDISDLVYPTKDGRRTVQEIVRA